MTRRLERSRDAESQDAEGRTLKVIEFGRSYRPDRVNNTAVPREEVSMSCSSEGKLTLTLICPTAALFLAALSVDSRHDNDKKHFGPRLTSRWRKEFLMEGDSVGENRWQALLVQLEAWQRDSPEPFSGNGFSEGGG